MKKTSARKARARRIPRRSLWELRERLLDLELCYFCDCEMPAFLTDDPVLIDLHSTPIWACYANGHLDLDDVSCFESVCDDCSVRLVGPNWFEVGRAELARHAAFEAMVPPFTRRSYEIH